MRTLDHPLYTPRLRLEPVTVRLALAAREGDAALADALGVSIPDDWGSGNLVARSATPRWGPSAPIRAIAIHREDDCVIGDVRFEPSPRAVDEVEIGYGIAASRRRQGYATEAAGAVIDWLFQEGGAAEIIAGCDRRNVASVCTLRKLGFWLDGSAGRAFWWLLTPDLRQNATARL